MAIPQLYASQTDVPELLREHYTEKEGKWVLVTDPPLEDVTGLKNALSQERNLRRDAEKLHSDLKIKFEGIDPDEVLKLRERVKGLDDADVYDKQGIEVLIARRTESMKADHERVLGTKERELSQTREALAQMEQRWKQDRIRTALHEAIASSGVVNDAREDAVSRGLSVFTDLDEHGNVVAKQGDEVRYGKDGINPLSPSEWIANLKAEGRARHLWPPSSGGGAPPYHGTNGEQIDWAALPPAERMTRFRELQSRR